MSSVTKQPTKLRFFDQLGNTGRKVSLRKTRGPATVSGLSWEISVVVR
jgi:hypothetical protein